MKTPGREEIWQMAASQNRKELFEAVLSHVPLGTRMIADADKVGAANAARCTMTIAEWDAEARAPKTTGLCKGTFFSCFGVKQKTRRCEPFPQDGDFCTVCKEVRATAKDGKIALAEVQAYAIEDKLLMGREGVKNAMAFWDKKVAIPRPSL